MQREELGTKIRLCIIFIGAFALLPLNATSEEKCGPYDGVNLTDAPVLLEKILSEHKEWLADNEGHIDDPRWANLCGASLSDTYLKGANLSKADLEGANLSEANLTRANLSGANLWSTNLSEAYLMGANLSEANLTRANLSDASLNGANLSKADLYHANLSEADLTRANLSEANLEYANLSEAFLFRADLSEADLTSANLSEARLIQTDLTNARVTNAIFFDAQYEPVSVPLKGYLSGIKGLSTVWFEEESQGGLVLLRAAFKEVGLRELEREATYAIEHGKISYAPWLEKWIKLIFLEWASGYGLDYGRPIIILFSLIFPFALVYYFPISGRGGIKLFMVWSEERIVEDEPIDKPKRFIEPLIINPKNNRLRIIGFALYFSLLSAFHMGWRDLNVGNWISRVQPREFTLRAKGWVRTVSGIQSLISIYLLALWVLVYFGRPFE